MNNSYSKLVLGSIAALALTGSALAADLRVAPPRYVPTFNWTGCYGGVHAGADYLYDRNTAVTANTIPGGTPDFPVGYPFNEAKGVGALGGFQAGCNYQFGQWVIGAEGQFSWTGTDINSNNISPVLSAAGVPVHYTTSDVREPWLGTAALRFGYAWDKYFIYVKGGYGWGEFRSTTSNFNTGNAPLVVNSTFPVLTSVSNSSQTRGAYMVGAGIEHMFLQNVSFKTDFEYLDYGTKNVTSTDVFGGGTGIVNIRSAHAYEFLWKVGLNFYFGRQGGPFTR
jgi:outer membrane immunogenic protein